MHDQIFAEPRKLVVVLDHRIDVGDERKRVLKLC